MFERTASLNRCFTATQLSFSKLIFVFAGAALLSAPAAFSADAPAKPDADTLETSAAAPVDNRPVTQEQFKELLRVYKRTVDRFDKIETKVNNLPAGGGNGEAVDLGNLSSAGVGQAPVSTGSASSQGHSGAGAMPDFKVYFDLDFIIRPGVENLSFDNYHSFLFFEILPTPDIQFSFDVSPSPHYYELDYQVTPRLQLRAGKIWIPFDDMSPHNIFGGRVNVSRLYAETGAPAFLPDLWTDLGVGFKYNIIDKPKFSMELYGYIVNGFRDGGKDPVNPGSPYPSFADLPTAADNNRDKALGGRLHMLIAQKVGLGISYYNCRWNSDTGPNATAYPGSLRLSIFGVDGQIRIKNTEFRAGVASMTMDLPVGGPANRGGAYVELGQKFGKENAWKLMGRAGTAQLDDRVTDTNGQVDLGDEEIVGATLLWKPSLIQYSVEYNRDLEISPAKTNYSYFAARIVMAF